MRYNWDIEKNMCWRDGAPGLKPSLFQIRYEDISLRCYDNPERSCAGVYKIETHAWAPRIPWHLTSGEKQMNLKYKELRREAPTRHIMESKHTEAAPPEGRRTAVINFFSHFRIRAAPAAGFLRRWVFLQYFRQVCNIVTIHDISKKEQLKWWKTYIRIYGGNLEMRKSWWNNLKNI